MIRLDARGTLASRKRWAGCGLGQDSQDFVLAQDEDVFAVDADLRARILAEEDLVADLDVESDLRPVLQHLAVAGGEDLAFLGLLLGRVRDDDPALCGLLLLDAANDQTIVQRTYLHRMALPFQSADGLCAGSFSTSWMTSASEAAGPRRRLTSRTAVPVTSAAATTARDIRPGQDDTSSFMEASLPND